MSRQYYLLIDIALCQDCGACYLACKDEFYDNTFPGYSLPQARHRQKWISHPRKERGHGSLMDIFYRPGMCMHCANAPCAKADKNRAVKIRPDGIVLLDPELAKGRAELAKACPYQAVTWNEEWNVPQKCTLCAHLLDNGWKETRCAQICPTGAIKTLHLSAEERDSLIRTEKLEVYRPELNTSPHVLYKNLHLFTKAFIAGSVAKTEGALTDCVEGAVVGLAREGGLVAETLTDNYGDFKFDGLEEDSGVYRLNIDAGQKGGTNIEVRLGKSVYLENISL
jgi:Fe-S-cluster-containing dehydrogenase component